MHTQTSNIHSRNSTIRLANSPNPRRNLSAEKCVVSFFPAHECGQKICDWRGNVMCFIRGIMDDLVIRVKKMKERRSNFSQSYKEFIHTNHERCGGGRVHIYIHGRPKKDNNFRKTGLFFALISSSPFRNWKASDRLVTVCVNYSVVCGWNNRTIYVFKMPLGKTVQGLFFVGWRTKYRNVGFDVRFAIYWEFVRLGIFQ